MERSQNKLVLTGLELAQLGREAVLDLIGNWVIGTGARNVTSGVIRCDADEHLDCMVYSCHFDSSHWTGIGFQGFDKKHPGEPINPS